MYNVENPETLLEEDWYIAKKQGFKKIIEEFKKKQEKLIQVLDFINKLKKEIKCLKSEIDNESKIIKGITKEIYDKKDPNKQWKLIQELNNKEESKRIKIITLTQNLNNKEELKKKEIIILENLNNDLKKSLNIKITNLNQEKLQQQLKNKIDTLEEKYNTIYC